MNKKNGFTLIELLAVILILAIIALIAVPTVKKIVEDSKKGAFEATLGNIDRKVNETCSKELLKGKVITSVYTIANGIITPHVDLKGKLPDGTVNVDSSCGVTYTLSDKDFTGIKENKDDKPTISKNNGTSTSSNDEGKYQESELNGATPKRSEGMIPVTIADNGTVTKADIDKEWYNYTNKKWANVVLVKKSTRGDYQKADPGSTINTDDILAYLVWIPRFKYAVISGKQEFSIIFENNKTAKSTGDATGTNYYTHPAFTFGDDELNGIWVGKFETTLEPSNPCNTTTCATSDYYDVNPTILPNAFSMRIQDAGTQFKTASKITSDTYGVTYDSHMMKNSEWGAAAYLTRSIYGINKEIKMNNNDNHLTGCGASTDGYWTSKCIDKFGTVSSYLQSTTGNITGIFDMSGGSRERVMAVYNNNFTDSGFTVDTIPNAKYYDSYTNTNINLACNGAPCKGHALSEVKSWTDNISVYTDKDYLWITRGYYYYEADYAGIFSAYGDYGNTNSSNSIDTSYRIVISDHIKN